MTDLLSNVDDDFDMEVLDTYHINLAAIEYKCPDGHSSWSFVLEFLPFDIVENKEDLDNPSLVLSDPRAVVSKKSWPHFQYALEAGMEAMELFGESVDNIKSMMVWMMDDDTGELDPVEVTYDGDIFKVVK